MTRVRLPGTCNPAGPWATPSFHAYTSDGWTSTAFPGARVRRRLTIMVRAPWDDDEVSALHEEPQVSVRAAQCEDGDAWHGMAEDGADPPPSIEPHAKGAPAITASAKPAACWVRYNEPDGCYEWTPLGRVVWDQAYFELHSAHARAASSAGAADAEAAALEVPASAAAGIVCAFLQLERDAWAQLEVLGGCLPASSCTLAAHCSVLASCHPP